MKEIQEGIFVASTFVNILFHVFTDEPMPTETPIVIQSYIYERERRYQNSINFDNRITLKYEPFDRGDWAVQRIRQLIYCIHKY